ncbi:hypothetical protein HYC85_024476 [Camellia sinensis]|uniref:Uncharacterized protein n=1 Tax=Camellia sinensis TaxID=4442 RepID=A0A7J7G877_CAMSI|nr:hypothetical protein HYC85_024476 [Camellia sinensis]
MFDTWTRLSMVCRCLIHVGHGHDTHFEVSVLPSSGVSKKKNVLINHKVTLLQNSSRSSSLAQP